MDNQTNVKSVMNKRIAIELANRGFDIVNVFVGKDDPKKVIFLFEDTEKLNNVFGEIVSQRKAQREKENLDRVEAGVVLDLLVEQKKTVSDEKEAAVIDSAIEKLEKIG